jgi:hypothetical protein
MESSKINCVPYKRLVDILLNICSTFIYNLEMSVRYLTKCLPDVHKGKVVFSMFPFRIIEF